MRWSKIRRFAAHRDKAERSIKDALEAAGATVVQLDAVDLLVGYRGDDFLLEVKDPAEVRVHKRLKKDGTPQTSITPATDLTDDQREWHAWWRGRKPVVVRTPEEALRAIGAIR